MLLLLVVPFAVALVALSVLGFAGIGPLTDERRAVRDGSMRAIGPAVGLLLGSVLLVATVIASLVVVGIGGGDSGGRERGKSRLALPRDFIAIPCGFQARPGRLLKNSFLCGRRGDESQIPLAAAE